MKDFVARFMGNEIAKREFPEQKQRLAVAYNKYRQNKQMFNLSYPIQIIESRETASPGESEFQIEGIALNAITTDNNHKFVAEELRDAADTLKNVRLLKDHDNSVDSIVGWVTGSEYNEEDQNIKFKAVIKDEDIKKKIKDGRINSVSIGANVRELEESDDGNLIPRGINFKELSLVAVPADEEAQFTTFRGSNFEMAVKEAWKSQKEEEPEDELELDEEVEEKQKSYSSEILANKQLNSEKEMEKDEKVSEVEYASKEEVSKISEDVSKLSEQVKAQTDLLADALNRIKESDADENKEEEAKEEEKKEEEPVEEPEKEEKPKEEEPAEEKSKKIVKEQEEKEEEEEPEEEDSAEEKSGYKIVEGYRTFTVKRDQKSLGSKPRKMEVRT